MSTPPPRRRLAYVAVVPAVLFGISCSSAPGLSTAAHPLLNINGPIAGLQGTGLVLQNNGAGDLVFPTPLIGFVFPDIKSGSSYVITVKTQPTAPSQTCVVINGTGVVGDNPPTNISVSCTTNAFAVQGNISGLTGTGLQLSLNGSTALSVAAAATSFTFPAILSGTTYLVSISAQPALQTCSINGASGTVGAAAVTNVAVTCLSGAAGLTVAGTVSGLGASGLTLRLNGGTPLAVAAGATTFAFPDALKAGDTYSVGTAGHPSGPQQTCVLGRARGKLSQSVADISVRCFPNAALDSYGGTFVIVQNGRRSYLTLWLDGSFSFASRTDDVTCTNSGNGSEYGTYRRATSNAFSFYVATIDTNGGCGVWSGSNVPQAGAGFEGTMVRSGGTLTLGSASQGTYTLNAVESVPTSLVGAFTRADGTDGSFVVFESDGTYVFQETQDAGGVVGYERGCYTVNGAGFTTSLASTCKPNGLSAFDANGGGGFSGLNGASIPFAITSDSTATIGGVKYTRIVPIG